MSNKLHFCGAREIFKCTSPAPEKPGKYLKTPFPAPEKYLYTLFRRRRIAYIHLSGAGEAGELGEAEEVFIYTAMNITFTSHRPYVYEALNERKLTFIKIVIFDQFNINEFICLGKVANSVIN